MATIEELEAQMTPLCHLCREYGSDKGGAHYRAGEQCHNYTPTYHELFKDRCDKVKNVFEIGISHGSSLRMWRAYFPNADIIGIDNNRNCLFTEDFIQCFHADQNDAASLDRVMALLDHRKFDLIIDDGSHERDHQIFSARHLLPFLTQDGVYVIEDIYPDCQPALVGAPIVAERLGFSWRAISTGHGLGVAQCGCGCGQGEQLVVFTHG